MAAFLSPREGFFTGFGWVEWQALPPRVAFPGSRRDILVEAEQIRRVVLPLELHELLVLRAECAAHHRIALLLAASEVEVAPAI
jgi:hypothetical protein